MLPDVALKCLKPKGKVYKVADWDGMYVRVMPSGAISFRLDYRINGPRRRSTSVDMGGMGYRSPRRADREPIKRRRDFAQAEAVAQLAATYFEHLPFDATAMQALPKTVFKAANLKFAR